jgi:ABC-type uncharacterized transport system permease subunit
MYPLGMSILLYGLPLLLYATAFFYAVSAVRAQGSSRVENPGVKSRWGVWLLGLAVLTHGLGLWLGNGAAEPPRFGFAQALSVMLFGGTLLLWLESLAVRIEPLWLLILPVAAFCTLLPVFFQGNSIALNASRPLFIPHLVIGMLAYSFLALAALHAILMIVAERSLHRPAAIATNPWHQGKNLFFWLDQLPPLLVLERILFRILLAGFVLLTLTLLTGVVFSEEVFGKPWRLEHKTVFSVIAWTIFAVLLAGRTLWGWRGRLAARITLMGFGLLLLAYVGSRFVLEVLLQRA